MYICICKAITESQVKSAIKGGASSVRDLYDGLGVASCCGKCALAARQVIIETQAGQHSSANAISAAA